ncbi:RteC domain-containing protein [Mucilaginibacter segetis]|uniref:RteC domain-containing protein n=1 Tax=Mucilaginibacter segetis TaxID=2793071 RepID=A0A934PSL7_9SPHI|nr:RteC domain-containing protein [Mucilaginibacter segetis]MBK0379319.1 RteC domain-containing protein [Mucilaginibacter segetis]
MKNITERFLQALENQLAEISGNGETLTGQYKASILICKKAMSKLKNYMASYAFESTEEEIHFFKTVKPQFYSKYIYYINIYNYHMQKPAGNERIQTDYIHMHQHEIKTFFDHNRAFYAYYRSGMTQLDQAYYTRGGFDVHLELEDFEEDEQYSTSHDYKLSKIIANERFQDYLNLEMAKLHTGITDWKIFLPFKLPNWTAAKVDAVELIYALKASGAINNGNIDIAELITLWETIFQVDLKESYHKFTDITNRKKEIPVFLNKLTNALLRWITDKMGL